MTSDVLNSARKVKTGKALNTDSSKCKPKCSSEGVHNFPVCDRNAAVMRTNFQSSICLVPPTSQSSST